MSKVVSRLETIVKKINFIENIVKSKGGITFALEDDESSRASIMMHLTSIAEQFDKLSKDGEFEILSKFDKNDLKGSYDIRNYIVPVYGIFCFLFLMSTEIFFIPLIFIFIN